MLFNLAADRAFRPGASLFDTNGLAPPQIGRFAGIQHVCPGCISLFGPASGVRIKLPSKAIPSSASSYSIESKHDHIH
jgi:hypothetical protein